MLDPHRRRCNTGLDQSPATTPPPQQPYGRRHIARIFGVAGRTVLLSTCDQPDGAPIVDGVAVVTDDGKTAGGIAVRPLPGPGRALVVAVVGGMTPPPFRSLQVRRPRLARWVWPLFTPRRDGWPMRPAPLVPGGPVTTGDDELGGTGPAPLTDRQIAAQLAEALRLTAEYALLPAQPGWPWYDTLAAHFPHMLVGLDNEPWPDAVHLRALAGNDIDRQIACDACGQRMPVNDIVGHLVGKHGVSRFDLAGAAVVDLAGGEPAPLESYDDQPGPDLT